MSAGEVFRLSGEAKTRKAGRRVARLKAGLLYSTVLAGGLVFSIGDAAAQALGEIVVTARKREESLQDAPISISAFTGDELERRLVTKITDITAFTPNITFEGTAPLSGSNSAAFIFVRGIGQTDFNQQTEPGVGLYVDGVYLGRSVGQVLDVLDVERVEVLRGPQGTLFGRNTIGGAISIVSKKPADEFGGYAEITTGSDDRIDAKGVINIPLTDNLFFRLSGGIKKRDGYVIRASDGLDLGDDDSLYGRVQLRWLPTEWLEVNFSADGTRERENGAPASLVAVNTTPVPPGIATTPLPPPGSPFPPNFPGIENCLQAGVAPPAFSLACTNGIVGDPRFYNSQWLPPSPFVTNGDGPFVQSEDYASDLDLFGLALTLDIDLGFAKVKSITSYRDLDSFFARDDDHSPVSITGTSNDYTQEQFSQEVQLNGDLMNGRLKYTTGVYYFSEEGTDINLVTAPLAFFQSGGSIDNRNVALFAQATFDLTDQLSITGGIRYTDEKKKYTPDQFIIDGKGFFPDGLLIQPMSTREVNIGEWTPMANISYRWTEDLMTYFTYSEGYKSGGFTQRIFPPQALIPDFAPEFVKVFEVGFKSELFNNRMRLNGAGFYTKYDDVQVVVQEGFAPQTKNAAKAHISGFELETVTALTQAWTFTAGVGYVDAQYDRLDSTVLGISLDSKFAYTPKWTLNASTSYTFDIGSLGTVTPRADWSYRSSFFTNAENTPEIKSGNYHIVNASLTWEDPGETFVVSVGVTNLTDEIYFPVASADLAVKGSAEAHWARPREWFLTTKVRF